MPFTLTCHVCGQKLTLFDLDVKKRKGTIRCNHCGAKINYDLDRKIQQSGFWAEREPAFDPRARKTVSCSRSSAKKRDGEKRWRRRAQSAKAPQHTFAEAAFAAKAGFASLT